MATARAIRRRRQGAAALLVLLAHATVLSMLGIVKPRLVAPVIATAPVNVWLMPRLTRAAPPSAAHAPAQATHAAVAQPAAKPPPTPTNPPTSPAQPPTAATATAAGPPASLGADAGQGVRQALRSRIGCDLGPGAHLTTEERDRCNQTYAETAKRGPKFIDTIPPEKRAYYDAVQAAYQASKDPMHPQYRDANGNIQTWGHPPAVGCTFKPHFKPGSSLSDKIKATGMIGVPIGPLSCGLALPQGSMTPEIGIPVP